MPALGFYLKFHLEIVLKANSNGYIHCFYRITSTPVRLVAIP